MKKNARPPIVEGEQPQLNLELGQGFSSPAEFKEYLRTESIMNGHNLDWKKTEGCRIMVKYLRNVVGVALGLRIGRDPSGD